MLKLYVSVPIASFRPGAAREFWESSPLPPPSTVYGFLLAMVGETERKKHIGVRCTAGLIGQPDRSTVLRKLWRVKELGKNKDGSHDFSGMGTGSNVRPDYQQLLTGVRLIVFVDSSEEPDGTETLESRLRVALDPGRRGAINRFGGLSLGESTHMVDEVYDASKLDPEEVETAEVFLCESNGNMTLPVWVDHVGAADTRYATGRLTVLGKDAPTPDRLPQIDNGDFSQVATVTTPDK